MKFTIGIQARSKSTRLPGKCLMPINGKPLWRHVYDEVKDIADTFMLVPFEHEDTDMWIATRDVPHMCGPMNSPLDRYLQLLEHEKPDRIIRLTADCTLVSRFIIMDMIRIVEREQYHYLQCDLDGMDVQIMSGKILTDPKYQDNEHVVNTMGTVYDMHLSINTQEQFDRISRMMDRRKNRIIN